MKKLLCISLVFLGGTLNAASNQEFNLSDFYQNPSKYMNRKKEPGARTINKDSPAFQEFSSNWKNTHFPELQDTGKDDWDVNNKPENLFPKNATIEKNISRLPKSGKTASVPWSSDYWAIARGVLSFRYNDPYSNETLDWKASTGYYSQPQDFQRLLSSGTPDVAKINETYSPSEKYDILVGDMGFTLTNTMKNEGRYYYEKYGQVEPWMGICHGWAPAAFMVERPSKTVTVKSAQGIPLTFSADDIRGLASLKWAQTSDYFRKSDLAAKKFYKSRELFIGGRCEAKDAKTDPKTDRILNPECFDVNPGTWHIVTANKIGIKEKSFVIDATFDYEVWNQPMYSYKVTYYNPDTEREGTLEESIIDYASFAQKDPFRNFRKTQPAKIVAVEMDIVYIAETAPSATTSRPDSLVSDTYTYDLELDSEGNITGGEWYTNTHPDFLWTPPEESKAMTRVDTTLVNNDMLYDGTPESLRTLTKAAALSSSKNQYQGGTGSPLDTVLEKLVELSR